MVLSVWSAGEPVGLVPLVEHGMPGLRTLASAATRDGDHWSMLAAAGQREAVADAVADFLSDYGRRWQWLRLDHITPPDMLEQRLRRRGSAAVVIERADRPRLQLDGSFDSYLASLAGRRRGTLRRRLRQLDDGRLVIRSVDPGPGLRDAVSRWADIRGRELAAKGIRANPVHADP